MGLPKFDYTLFNEATNELRGESDRAAALVGASILDTQLEIVLRKGMIKHKNVDKLFKNNGPLSTFHSKIEMAFLLGLFPHEKIYQDLHIIRDVRNKFAHGHKELTFSERSISDRIDSLNIMTLYRKSLKMHKEPEGEFDEKIKAFMKESRSPRKKWELAILSISKLLSAYEEYTEKPTLKKKRKITIAGADEN